MTAGSLRFCSNWQNSPVVRRSLEKRALRPSLLLRQCMARMVAATARLPMSRPFEIAVPQDTIEKIRARVRDFEWHEMPRGDGLDGTWAYGANIEYMRSLCSYWVEQYDWRKWEAALNRFPQFKANIGELELHFYKEIGSGPR